MSEENLIEKTWKKHWKPLDYRFYSAFSFSWCI